MCQAERHLTLDTLNALLNARRVQATGGSVNKLLIYRTVVALLSAMSFLHTAASATPSEEYALSEQCGRRVEDFWNREFIKSKLADFQFYENHYSRKLNKCFYVEITKMYVGSPYPHWISSYTLFDVNDHKQIAGYSGFSGDSELERNPETITCSVRDIRCSSKKEWDGMIKPYMED